MSQEKCLQTIDLFSDVNSADTRPIIPPCPHCAGKGEYFTFQSTTGLHEDVINIRCTVCTYISNGAVVIKPYTEQILIERWVSGFVGPMTDKPLLNQKTGEIVQDKINRTLWMARNK